MRNSVGQQWLIALCGLLLVACTTLSNPAVRGMVELAEKNVTVLDGQLQVTLADVSLADAPMRVLSTASMSTNQGFPITFALAYDPVQIQPSHTYAVSARVVSKEGKLLWINDTRYEVLRKRQSALEQESEPRVNMVLRKVN